MFKKTLILINQVVETSNSLELPDDLNLKITLLGSLCEQRFESQYGILMSESYINQLNGQISALNTHINNQKSNSNPTHITNIKNTINTTAELISKIPLLGKGESVAGVNNALLLVEQKNSEIITEINKTKDTFRGTVATLDNQIKTLSTKLAEEQSKVDRFSTDLQAQFSAAQEKRINDFAEQQKEITTKSETEFAEIKNTLKSYLDQFDADTKVVQNELEADFEKSLLDYNEKADQIIKQITNVKKEVNNWRSEIERIYNVVSGEALIGSTQKYASEAQKSARRLFIAAIGFMVGAVIVAFVAFHGVIFDGQEISDWKFLVFRFSFIVLALLPAMYFVNESRKQKNQEYKHRDMEVKMEILPSYFDKLDSCENEILATRLKLAEKIFSPANHNNKDKEKNSPLDNIGEVIGLVKSINDIKP